MGLELRHIYRAYDGGELTGKVIYLRGYEGVKAVST